MYACVASSARSCYIKPWLYHNYLHSFALRQSAFINEVLFMANQVKINCSTDWPQTIDSRLLIFCGYKLRFFPLSFSSSH